jgi:nucleoside-diphosphate-sugar epimerase
MLKIAVTGAGGFLGHHIVQELGSRDRVELIALTRRPAALSGLPANCRAVEFDMDAPTEGLYERIGRPDVLLHLAWGNLPNYLSEYHFETELPRQYRFLKGLIKQGIPRIVTAGTCFEYGMVNGALAATLVTNSYGLAKDVLHKQLRLLIAKHPSMLTWCRLFYMYGEGQSSQSLYMKMKASVANKDEVFNLSGGEQLRDFLPVAEVARILIDETIQPCGDSVMNICSGTPISVRRLVESWVEANDWQIKLNFGFYPYPEYEPMAFWGVPRINQNK